MILTMRRYLLVLLGLLQLVAPLVHAHSGNNFAQYGLHLPRFEIYSTVSSQQTLPILQAMDYASNLENVIVSISTGIQNSQNNSDDLSPLLYFPPTPFVFSSALTCCEINFSPQTTLKIKTFHHSPHSPRAPPFLS